MLPGDRLVCAFVETFAVGERFKAWPLHVTIVPWFRLPDSSETIAAGLEVALCKIALFEAVTGEQAMFGPHKSRPVALLLQSTSLTNRIEGAELLHKKRA